MPAPTPVSRRRPTRLPPHRRLPVVVPLAVAWAVIEEASLWLGEPLPDAWTAWLVRRAEGCIAHTRGWRERFRRADTGRDLLYVFMRHWLASRFYQERPDLLARLPRSYATGVPLPARTAVALPPALLPVVADDRPLSPDARLLVAI